jgi:pimeloyl-ACP methyl ester carboxylesterase
MGVQRSRIGFFSVHGISRHEPLKIAADVADGLKRWAESVSGTPWQIDYEERRVGRRRPRSLPRYVVCCEDAEGPAFVVSESNWSDISKNRFRRYTLHRWLSNTLNSLGEATRSLNRKTAVESLYALAPFAVVPAVALLILRTLQIALRTDPVNGVLSLPVFMLVSLAAAAFARALARPFFPSLRLHFRLYTESLARYEHLPNAFKHLSAVLDSFNRADHKDPLNILLLLWSSIRGSLSATAYIVAATLYAVPFTHPRALPDAARHYDALDWSAVIALSLVVRFFVRSLRWLKNTYEPIEDIYSYTDTSHEARKTRNEVIAAITTDLRSFITSTDIDEVILCGHSLGSVLVLDAFAELIRDVLSDRLEASHLTKVRSIVLYGSPFSKILAQVRAIRPGGFASDMLRWELAYGFSREIALQREVPFWHSAYYLTDIVSEKITGEGWVQNYLLPSPWTLWSHGHYHADQRFWSTLEQAGALPTLARVASSSRLAANQAKFAVPSHWPAPSWRQIAWGFPKLIVLLTLMRWSTNLISHGLNPALGLLFVFLVMIVMELKIKD